MNVTYYLCSSVVYIGSRKSQMSMLSSREPLTIWKSSNCRLGTTLECFCDKSKENYQSWPGHTNQMSTQLYHCCCKCTSRVPLVTWSIPVVINIYLPLMTKPLLFCTLKYQRLHLYSQTSPNALSRFQFRRTHYQTFSIMVPFHCKGSFSGLGTLTCLPPF